RTLSLPPSSLILLAWRLDAAGENADAVALRRWARKDHAADFWILFDLGSHLTKDRGGVSQCDFEEGIWCLRTALALRPKAAVAHYNLGHALTAMKQWD